ncbi:hypothetical protein EXIGLDRAFT_776164 [Exidia glandulosa HHB12029]|uniref:MIF4G domain-containing protein n=1 Tax=Exidia glandulosa HHB12029 TaxID=1314781 RepID=A0A165DKV3_EXIGL|nr:hypothetical protein EXIGLDRAFT_776164 [Exidia glandulosa HHB12029]
MRRGQPITGGLLFRKYLLNQCQEDFERGWTDQAKTAAAAAEKVQDDEVKKKSNQTAQGGAEVSFSDEYYAAQKSKRRDLGLVRFIGELFKLQMLTERIMHECIKTLLSNVANPGEEEIESICKLLTTVGQLLDTSKARSDMDIYFKRMCDLSESPNIDSRMKYMLLDVIELRSRAWIPRNAVAAPTTLASVHEQAAKEKAAAEKENAARMSTMSRGGSRRGDNYSEYGSHTGADGWSTPSGRPPPNKVGDLSQFGKINKASPGVVNLGPSSVFAGKKGDTCDSASLSRSSSNPFRGSLPEPQRVVYLQPDLPKSSCHIPGPTPTTAQTNTLFSSNHDGKEMPLSRKKGHRKITPVAVESESSAVTEAEPAQVPSTRGRGRGRGRGARGGGRGTCGSGRSGHNGGREGTVQPAAVAPSMAETNSDDADVPGDTAATVELARGRGSRSAAVRARERLVQMDGVQKKRVPNPVVLAPKVQHALLNILHRDSTDPNIRVVRNVSQEHSLFASDTAFGNASDGGSEIDFEFAPAQSTAISDHTVDQSEDLEMVFDLNMGPRAASDVEDVYDLDAVGSDSEEEVQQPPPRRKAKRAAPVLQVGNVSQPAPRTRVLPAGPRPLTVQLLVPNYASTKKTIELTSATYVKVDNPDLDTARKTIKTAFSATEDDNIVLEYKMYRSEPLKHPLVTPEDWSKWLDNIEKYEKKKKFLETISVFFFSPTLEERAAATKGSKTGVESLGLSGVTQENKEWYRQLKEHLEANPCGRPACKDRFCKIDVYGGHGLSLQEYQAWADALPKGIDGATLNRPPRNAMFKRYHRDLLHLPDSDRLPLNTRGQRDREPTHASPPSTIPSLASSHYFQNFDRILQGATPMTLHAPAPSRIMSKVRGPKIPDFLAEMQENEGNVRNYIKYTDAFKKHELCFIGELSEWTLAQFQERIEMPIGPAQMVLQGIADKLAQLSLEGVLSHFLFPFMGLNSLAE